MSLTLRPTSLFGRHVRLLPLRPDHAPGLTEVGLDPAIWRYYTHGVRDADGMDAWVSDAIADPDAEPFALYSIESRCLVGSSRYMAIDRLHHRVEIGSTWIAPRWQRSAINTEAKLLLLGHAFDTLGCHRVELKTDATNIQSRAAIERIGATYEGLLRKHMVAETGRFRDSVYYSIIEEEWPGVREQLIRRLG